MIPPSFEKIDDEVYRQKVDNGCPYHTLRCNLTKGEIADLVLRLRMERETIKGSVPSTKP